MASLLKKKAQTYNNPDSIREIHEKAKTTLAVLTRNLISGDIPLESIFAYYDEYNRENVIRLLLRCKKMYEARVDVKKILSLLIIQQDLFQKIAFL